MGFFVSKIKYPLASLVAKTETIAIVDSTRRGKLMPDALLASPHLVCCYIHHNGQELFADLDNVLYTPRSMVSESEHNEIAKINHLFWKQNDSISSIMWFPISL